MKAPHRAFRLSSGFLAGAALSLTLAGCSFYQSDASFFGSAQPTTEQLTKDNLAKAHQLRLEKKYSEAVKILSQLVLANPDDVQVLAEYGKTLTEQGRAKEAREFLNRATELRPNDWTLYSALGVAWDQSGQPGKAEDAYKKALQLKPGDPAILNNYALSRLMAGDPDAAQTLIRQAMQNGSTPRIVSNAQLIAEVARSHAAALQAKQNPPQKPAGDLKPSEIRKAAKPIISDEGPLPQPRPDRD